MSEVDEAVIRHATPGVPTTLAPYPDRTLLDYLTDLARDRANHPALLFKGTTLTWSGLERLSDACASAFHALGVKRSDGTTVVGDVAEKTAFGTAKFLPLRGFFYIFDASGFCITAEC